METENNKKGIKLIICFSDKAKEKGPITLENPNEAYLRGLNNESYYGIFETANSFFATQEQLSELAIKKGKESITKRNKEFLTCLNEVFGDLDVCKESDKLPEEERERRKRELKEAIEKYCPASVYVITKNGLQPRWLINEPNIDEFTQQKYVNVTNGIIEWSKQNGAKGDPVKDVTRVLRKPGYYHHKSDPYLITEEKGNDKIYTLDELSNYFWFEPQFKLESSMQSGSDSAFNKVDALDIRQVVIDAWREKGNDAQFDKDDHLIVDGKMTATFKGRQGGNYMATTSSDYPAKGNSVTYVAETLKISTKEAFKWLCRKYNIDSEEGVGQGLIIENLPDPINAEELCSMEFPPIDWMIHRLIPNNQITVISGPPGGFKTMTILEWAIKVVTGGKAYNNFDTSQCGVLIVNEDGDAKKNIKKRILLLTEKPDANLHFLVGTSFKIEEKFISPLLDIIKKRNIKFIIFDSFRGIMPSDKDEDDAAAVRQVINKLRPLTDAGATILIIHHNRKKPANLRGYTSTDPNDLGEMMSGSADIRGAVDCHIAMSSGKDKKENQFYIIATQTKCREEELLPPFKVVVNKEKDEQGNITKLEFLYDGEYELENAEETLNKAKGAILEFLFKSKEKDVWRKVIIDNKPGGFSGRTLDSALKVLEKTDRAVGSKAGAEMGFKGSEATRKYYFIKEKETMTNEMILEQMESRI
jgi:hypothetical protein